MARPGLAGTVLGVGVIAHARTVMQRTSLTLANGRGSAGVQLVTA